MRLQNRNAGIMQPIEPQTLIFRHIQDGDVTSKFSIGDASKVSLKIFIQKEALEFMKPSDSRCLILKKTGKVSIR